MLHPASRRGSGAGKAPELSMYQLQSVSSSTWLRSGTTSAGPSKVRRRTTSASASATRSSVRPRCVSSARAAVPASPLLTTKRSGLLFPGPGGLLALPGGLVAQFVVGLVQRFQLSARCLDLLAQRRLLRLQRLKRLKRLKRFALAYCVVSSRTQSEGSQRILTSAHRPHPTRAARSCSTPTAQP